MKKRFWAALIIAIILVCSLSIFASCGDPSEEKGPSYTAQELQKMGNNPEYSVEQTAALEHSDLQGKTLFWLGSSVTYGAQSQGETMADYIAKRNTCTSVKEAVSGTTLRMGADTPDSYIERMIDGAFTNFEGTPDIFICQLSTNDVKTPELYGEVTAANVKDIDAFDTTTTCGAIEYIIAYVRQTWNCPVAFWSNAYYDNTHYAELVAKMKDIAAKWDILFWNMYDDTDFNNISRGNRLLYMADQTHPKRAGYQLWWTPWFEARLLETLK